MIVFDLECMNGHTFEGWFDDKKDMESQQERGQLQCPVCDTTSVVQKVHPIAIRTTPACQSPQARQALQAHQEVLMELTERVSRYVEKNFENVGTEFAAEALKMHYGTTDYRNIRGTATTEEEKVLDREGVPVLKVPILKNESEDLN
jgi:hypothetical protein